MKILLRNKRGLWICISEYNTIMTKHLPHNRGTYPRPTNVIITAANENKNIQNVQET